MRGIFHSRHNGKGTVAASSVKAALTAMQEKRKRTANSGCGLDAVPGRDGYTVELAGMCGLMCVHVVYVLTVRDKDKVDLCFF